MARGITLNGRSPCGSADRNKMIGWPMSPHAKEIVYLWRLINRASANVAPNNPLPGLYKSLLNSELHTWLDQLMGDGFFMRTWETNTATAQELEKLKLLGGPHGKAIAAMMRLRKQDEADNPTD